MFPTWVSATTYYNAVRNSSGWTTSDSSGTTSSTPSSSPSAGSTFRSTNGGTTPALSILSDNGSDLAHNFSSNITNTIDGGFYVSSSARAYLVNNNTGTLTNTITGGITVNDGGRVLFDNTGSGTLRNTITGGITVSGASTASFSPSYGSNGTVVNTIAGGITLSGTSVASFYKSRPGGSYTNTITGGITISDTASANFNKQSTGTLVNDISGGITVNNSGSINLASLNSLAGTLTNTIDTLTLNDTSTLKIGGTGSTTTISTLNWNGGTIGIILGGSTTIETLNLGTGTIKLQLLNTSGSSSLTSISGITGTQTLFTVTGTTTGDLSRIELVNGSPFSEVIANGTTNGVTVGSDGKVTITTVPTATTGQSNALEALGAANELLPGLQTSIANLESSFAPTAYQQAKVRADMKRIMYENPRDPGEALITALAQERSGTVVKIRGSWRVFAAPFASEIRNNGLGGYMAGIKEKFYGILMGGSHYFKKSGVTLLGMIGLGASKTQQDRSVNSFSNGKNVMLGVNARKIFVDPWKINWDAESNLSGIGVRSVQ